MKLRNSARPVNPFIVAGALTRIELRNSDFEVYTPQSGCILLSLVNDTRRQRYET